jgi:hypothetical protein
MAPCPEAPCADMMPAGNNDHHRRNPGNGRATRGPWIDRGWGGEVRRREWSTGGGGEHRAPLRFRHARRKEAPPGAPLFRFFLCISPYFHVSTGMENVGSGRGQTGARSYRTGPCPRGQKHKKGRAESGEPFFLAPHGTHTRPSAAPPSPETPLHPFPHCIRHRYYCCYYTMFTNTSPW